MKNEKQRIQSQFEGLQSEIDTQQLKNKTLKEQIQELQSAYDEILHCNEKNDREVKAKDEIIQQLTESYTNQVTSLRNDVIEMDQRKSLAIERCLMEYEELRMVAHQFERQVMDLVKKRLALEMKLKRLENENDKQRSTIRAKTREVEDI